MTSQGVATTSLEGCGQLYPEPQTPLPSWENPSSPRLSGDGQAGAATSLGFRLRLETHLLS